MAIKIFADTNIIVDLIEQRPFDLASIHKIVKMAESGEIEIYVSETVITNALYITKLPGHVEKTLDFVKVICIGHNCFQKALRSSFKDKEDAILYFGALNEKLEYFITRDTKDFLNHTVAQLPVMNATAFLKKIL
jgi:predicted nucleic acid-binding protein